MNKITAEERVRVVACLVEGNSLRATTRMTGVHRTTVMKLLADLGEACSKFQDATFRNLNCKRQIFKGFLDAFPRWEGRLILR